MNTIIENLHHHHNCKIEITAPNELSILVLIPEILIGDRKDAKLIHYSYNKDTKIAKIIHDNNNNEKEYRCADYNSFLISVKHLIKLEAIRVGINVFSYDDNKMDIELFFSLFMENTSAINDIEKLFILACDNQLDFNATGVDYSFLFGEIMRGNK